MARAALRIHIERGRRSALLARLRMGSMGPQQRACRIETVKRDEASDEIDDPDGWLPLVRHFWEQR